MRVFTCVVCGKLAVSMQNGGKGQKYCSKACKAAGHRALNGGGGRIGLSCRYNEYVACDLPSCENCGWNPAVEKRRKESWA